MMIIIIIIIYYFIPGTFITPSPPTFLLERFSLMFQTGRQRGEELME